MGQHRLEGFDLMAVDIHGIHPRRQTQAAIRQAAIPHSYIKFARKETVGAAVQEVDASALLVMADGDPLEGGLMRREVGDLVAIIDRFGDEEAVDLLMWKIGIELAREI